MTSVKSLDSSILQFLHQNKVKHSELLTQKGLQVVIHESSLEFLILVRVGKLQHTEIKLKSVVSFPFLLTSNKNN